MALKRPPSEIFVSGPVGESDDRYVGVWNTAGEGERYIRADVAEVQIDGLEAENKRLREWLEQFGVEAR